MSSSVQTNLSASNKNTGSILIDGASGYVGSHLTHYLRQSGVSVRCLVRPQTNAYDLKSLATCNPEIFQADLGKRSDVLENAFSQAEVAIHLIGSVAPRKGETLEALHINQTKRFLEMCKQARVSKVVMVTTLGASADADNQYQLTKWLAEKEMRASGLPCIFVRPSLLIGRTFGRRDSKLVRRLRELLEKKRPLPVIGGGHNKIQPLFIDDAVAGIAKCALSYPALVGQDAPILEFGGPEIMTMRQFVQELMSVMGSEERITDIPILVAQAIAFFAQMMQEVPIVSCDQVKLSMVDNVCRENDLETRLGITLTNVGEALRSYTRARGNLPVLEGSP